MTEDRTLDPVVAALLERHGRTYAAEAGIDPSDGTPTSLFRQLCLSLLLSARIRASVAVRAARALAEAGWVDPAAMARSTWEHRCLVLDDAGYARYDERTSHMLAATAERVLAEYHGDLGELRDRALREPTAERKLLQEFPGIGPLGATIFAREIQSTWTELYPFADDRAIRAAGSLGLDADPVALSRLLAGRAEFTRLVAALVRCSLAHDEAAVLDRARAITRSDAGFLRPGGP
ncbi:MAG: endonuclease [Candidatus Nanopelagicales bacterium]